MTDPIIEVANLRKDYSQATNIVDRLFKNLEPVRAVDNVNLTVNPREIIGVIGESGCGKTTLLKTVLQIEEPTAGTVKFEGQDITTAGAKTMKRFRRNVRLIFQDPFNSLNPRLPIRQIVKEPLKIHDFEGDHDERAREVLREVELTPPDKFLGQYPTQLSGGERQRVAIARALVVDPQVVFADEPLSMLDVSTQSSLMKLLTRLSTEQDISIVYISHDLSTVAHLCKEVNVMYLGRIVESAPTRQLITDPKHPYTQALIASTPIPDPHYNREFEDLPGSPSDPVGLGAGCRFRDRCPERMEVCDKTPFFVSVESNHHAACHLYYDHEQKMKEHSVGSRFEEGTMEAE